MKKLNNKGFMISTLIYGVFILFILLFSVLIYSINVSLRLNADKVNKVNNYETIEEVGFTVEKPDLTTGLVPIKYITNDDGSGYWVIADPNEKWYDYDKQMWANAVSLDLSSDAQKNKFLDDYGNFKVGVELVVPDKNETKTDVLAWFVWIPRYSYQIRCGKDVYNSNKGITADVCYGSGDYVSPNPSLVDVKFIPKSKIHIYDGKRPTFYTNTNEDYGWYTHPAFWWDEDSDGIREDGEELGGIWVGKFETGSSGSDSGNIPLIVPDVAIKGDNLYECFTIAQKFSANNNVYGITGDSHMMKNVDWGAVAYLSQSKYGKAGNDDYEGKFKEIFMNNSSDTGKCWPSYPGNTAVNSSLSSYYNEKSCFGASTTGDITGIYGMSGLNEYIMAYYENPTSIANNGWGGNSKGNDTGFNNSNKPASKYYDSYSNLDIYQISYETIGHGTAEIVDRVWYSGDVIWYWDNNEKLSDADPWVTRGGFDSDVTNKENGLFAVRANSGIMYYGYGFRVVLVKL